MAPHGNPSRWSVHQVCDWLHTIGYSSFAPAFASNHIDGGQLLALTSKDLSESLNMARLGDRKTFLQHVDNLRAVASGGSSSSISSTGSEPRTTTPPLSSGVPVHNLHQSSVYGAHPSHLGMSGSYSSAHPPPPQHTTHYTTPHYSQSHSPPHQSHTTHHTSHHIPVSVSSSSTSSQYPTQGGHTHRSTTSSNGGGNPHARSVVQSTLGSIEAELYGYEQHVALMMNSPAVAISARGLLPMITTMTSRLRQLRPEDVNSCGADVIRQHQQINDRVRSLQEKLESAGGGGGAMPQWGVPQMHTTHTTTRGSTPPPQHGPGFGFNIPHWGDIPTPPPPHHSGYSSHTQPTGGAGNVPNRHVSFNGEYEDEEPKPFLRRQLSVRSVKALETLDDLSNEMHELEAHVRGLQGVPEERDEIAQIFGKVDKLLATRIDGVATSELNSGKEAARTERKELVTRAQSLMDTLQRLQAFVGGGLGSSVSSFEGSVSGGSQNLSPRSKSALEALNAIGRSIGDLERALITLDGSDHDAVSALRGRVEGYVGSLDGVNTGDLLSGKAEARQQRKALVIRAENLGSKLQEIIVGVSITAPMLPSKNTRFADEELRGDTDSPPPRIPTRGMSVRSVRALETLDDLSVEVADLEVRVQQLRGAPEERAEIVQLFGTVDKLLATRIDGVVTSELHSGKDAARTERRELVARAQAMLDLLLRFQSSDDGGERGESPPPRPLNRVFSVRSVKALETLDDLSAELHELEAHVHGLRGAPEERDEIAQLFGTVDKLLATRIDGVATSELNSGKDAARTERKELVTRAQGLLDTLQRLQGGR